MSKKFITSLSILATLGSHAYESTDLKNEYLKNRYNSHEDGRYTCEKIYKNILGQIKEKATIYLDLKDKTITVESLIKGYTKTTTYEFLKIENNGDGFLNLIGLVNTNTDYPDQMGERTLYKFNPTTKVIVNKRYAFGLGKNTPLWSKATASCD